MWIFASKVDSSAHLHADNFAYICIKRTEWCLNPTCSTFSLCFTPLPSAPIDCLHIFCLSRFARHMIGDWIWTPSMLQTCISHVCACVHFRPSWSTMLLRGVVVANWLERFLGGHVKSGAGQIRHPQVSCWPCWYLENDFSVFFFFFLNISAQEHFPAGREKKKTQHYPLENLVIK